MRHFFFAQKSGYHTDDLAAFGQRRIGHRAHQADFAAAIHQRAAALGNGFAHGLGGFEISGFVAQIGAAIHHDMVHFIHVFSDFLLFGFQTA